jgi:hypothetical protein
MISPKPEDVKVDVSQNAQPTFTVTNETFFYSGGPISKIATGLKPVPFVTNLATIKVGKLPDPATAPNKWQFGYIQSCEVKQVFFGYSGKSYLQGSVGINLTPDGGFVAPDEFGELDKILSPTTDSAKIRPWTRAADVVDRPRFTFKSDQGIVESNTEDGPGGHIKTKISNAVTNLDNFLRTVVDHRRFCCALVVEEQGTSPVRRVVSHQIWDIKYHFELKWRNNTVFTATTTGSSFSFSQFTFGPPTDAAFANMLSAAGSVPVNDILPGRMSQAFTSKSKQYRTDSDTTTATKDFFS